MLNIITNLQNKIYTIEKELLDDWYQKAKISSEDFLQNNKKLIENIEFGCSLSPEQLQFEINKNNINKKQSVDIKSTVDYLEKMNIKNIRFGIRWNKVCHKENEFDFSYYHPWIEELNKRKMKICLNIGPIKTFRYPEDHVPSFVLKKLAKNLPNKNEFITENSLIAKEGMKYLTRLLKYLKKTYEEDTFDVFQPENEPTTTFGTHEWKMSREYLNQIIDLIHKYYPDKGIMINSHVTPDNSDPLMTTFEKTNEFVLKLREKYPQKKLIVGFNYYIQHPEAELIPNFLYKEKEVDNFEKQMDTYAVLKKIKGEKFIKDSLNKLKEKNIDIEISELQLEPWGKYTAPGNDVYLFHQVMLRAGKLVDRGVMRIWGVEHLMVGLPNKISPMQQSLALFLSAI